MGVRGTLSVLDGQTTSVGHSLAFPAFRPERTLLRMLQSLRIKNLALIENAHLCFGQGLTVLTGESGSGKSVILDALALIRGDARPRLTPRRGALSGLVEAEFFPPRKKDGSFRNSELTTALDNAGLIFACAPGEPLILARRLEESGRSRCFIQGQTVSRAVLSSVAASLLDLTGQGDAHRLKSKRAQLMAIDQFGGLASKRADVEKAVRKLHALEAQLELTQKLFGEAESRREFLEFQLEELRQCDVSLLDERRARLELLERAEKDRLAHAELLDCAKYGADGLIGRLSWLLCRLPQGTVEESSTYKISEEVNLALQHLETACRISEYEVKSSQRAQEELSDLRKSLRALDDLAVKHRILAAELPAKMKKLEQEQEAAQQVEAEFDDLVGKVEIWRKHTQTLAENLHGSRVEAAASLEIRIKGELQSVGLEEAQLQAHLSRGELTQTGISYVDIGFSANAGHLPASLSRVASGGELSRVLLCFRLATEPSHLLMSFDEIDAGAGGKTAEKIAQALLRAAKHGQVLCVTHWPQVAGVATHQLSVEKLIGMDGPEVKIETVTGEARVREISRMLGGNESTARKHASDLVTGSAAA